jgi:hypothetical protein
VGSLGDGLARLALAPPSREPVGPTGRSFPCVVVVRSAVFAAAGALVAAGLAALLASAGVLAAIFLGAGSVALVVALSSAVEIAAERVRPGPGRDVAATALTAAASALGAAAAFVNGGYLGGILDKRTLAQALAEAHARLHERLAPEPGAEALSVLATLVGGGATLLPLLARLADRLEARLGLAREEP